MTFLYLKFCKTMLLVMLLVKLDCFKKNRKYHWKIDYRLSMEIFCEKIFKIFLKKFPIITSKVSLSMFDMYNLLYFNNFK